MKRGEGVRIARRQAITDRVADTFGPNPCERMTFTHEETGEQLCVPCDGRRCADCGPRKVLAVVLQTEAGMPGLVYWTYYSSKERLNRDLARAKKQQQRAKDEWLYSVAGDQVQGYWVISNVELDTGGTFRKLAEVLQRFIDHWRRSAPGSRLRRTRVLGRVSLVAKKKERASRDKPPSKWVMGMARGLRQLAGAFNWSDAEAISEADRVSWQEWLLLGADPERRQAMLLGMAH
jgi:hypothetical protein